MAVHVVVVGGLLVHTLQHTATHCNTCVWWFVLLVLNGEGILQYEIDNQATKPVVWSAAMGEMAGRTARGEGRQHTRNVMSDSVAQAFVFESVDNRDRFKLGKLYTRKFESYFRRSHGSTVNQHWPGFSRMFKVRLGLSRTNAGSQWNPVYNALHRFFGCGNETIRR